MNRDYILGMQNQPIHFNRLTRDMFTTREIIHHLAWTCRYNGNMRKWYSNAEHSIHCSLMHPEREVQRAALIHDFGEFITGDVLGPIKRFLPDYTAFAESIQSQMNFFYLGRHVLPEQVKEIDKRMTATEMLYLRGWEGASIEPYTTCFFFSWEKEEAQFQLTRRFRELFPEVLDV